MGTNDTSNPTEITVDTAYLSRAFLKHPKNINVMEPETQARSAKRLRILQILAIAASIFSLIALYFQASSFGILNPQALSFGILFIVVGALFIGLFILAIYIALAGLLPILPKDKRIVAGKVVSAERKIRRIRQGSNVSNVLEVVIAYEFRLHNGGKLYGEDTVTGKSMLIGQEVQMHKRFGEDDPLPLVGTAVAVVWDGISTTHSSLL